MREDLADWAWWWGWITRSGQRQWKRLGLIVTSGYPENQASQGFRSAPVTGYLQKPYSLETLAQKIGETLGGVSTQTSRVFPQTA